MENASKALLMAAGILVGILIITLATYLFMTFGEYSNEVMEDINAKQIAQFNNNFYKYQGREECTIHDVITLANFAKENNQTNQVTDKNSQYYIQVKVR